MAEKKPAALPQEELHPKQKAKPSRRGAWKGKPAKQATAAEAAAVETMAVVETPKAKPAKQKSAKAKVKEPAKKAQSAAKAEKTKAKTKKAVKAEAAPKAEKKPEAPKPEKKAEKKPEAPRAPKAPKPEKKAEPKVEKKAEPKTYTPAEPGSVEEKIETFIAGLLEHMDSKAVPHCWKADGNTYKVDLVGDDLGYLIGRRGDTLDAIQHLANYTVNRDVEGHIRINVDAECYREKREDSLRRYARKKAQQVLKARRRTTLEPMNAYERHVIHAALQDMENITTHSTGTEPNRRVVIEYVR